MSDYAMNFELCVLEALDGVYRSTDILGLGDTNTWSIETIGFVENKNTHYPLGVVIALGASYKRIQKICGEAHPLYEIMEGLLEKLRYAKSYADYCVLVNETKETFDKNEVSKLVQEAK